VPTESSSASKPQPASAAKADASAPPANAALPPHRDPQSDLSKNSVVYFAYDRFTIEDAYKPVVEMHSKYLLGHPELRVRLEGNADERGSTEYNLALGSKRAFSVQHAMQALGVKEGQIESVSFGEDRPIAIGHDESSWSQNRRTEIVYPAK